MIVAYTGLAGSGKTYHMTQVALNLIAHNEIVFSRHEIEGAYPLVDERELLYMQHCHVFFDEWHQDHTAKDWYNLDEVVKHIVTQSRKYSIIIHWSAQHWLYMDSFIRRNTDFCWRHEALFRDPATGMSRFGLHRRTKVAGIEMELKHARPEVLANQLFLVRPKIYKKYDSFKPIMLSRAKLSDDEILAIKNPYSREATHVTADDHSEKAAIAFLKNDELVPEDVGADYEEPDTYELDDSPAPATTATTATTGVVPVER
jgi:hypothetical protein